jgi:hypothetical protein
VYPSPIIAGRTRPRVLQAIWEDTERRRPSFDGVFLKNVLGNNLGNQPQ